MPGWLQPYLGENLWPEADHIVRVVAAMVFGGLIGLERELRDKPAGFRTIILICVGACIFTIVSVVAGGPDEETTRIAAQIVTGIGFLGAGAILRDRANVIGLTTASTIWAVAAVGMAAGYGHIALGALGTVVILIALLVFDLVENWIGDVRDIQDFHVLTDNTEDAMDRVTTLFKENGLNVRKRFCHEEGESLLVHIVAMGAKTKHDRLRIRLARSNEYTLRGS